MRVQLGSEKLDNKFRFSWMLYEKELLCNLFPVKVGFHFAFTYFTVLIICLMTGPSRNQSVLFLSTNFNVSLGSTSRNIEFIRKQNKKLFTLKPVIESCTLFLNLIFGAQLSGLREVSKGTKLVIKILFVGCCF